MKKIGIIGGMSMESTIHYVQKINMLVNARLGGDHSAKIILYTVDFAEIVDCQLKGDWQKSTEILNHAAISLQKAGADFIIMATNTMHKVVDSMLINVDIPFLHIAHATLEQVKKANITKIGLLGTRFTLEEDFYKKIFTDNGVEVVIPKPADIKKVDRKIFGEFCHGEYRQETANYLASVIEEMAQRGAKAVGSVCTEVGEAIKDVSCVPVFDSTEIHAEAAVEFALS